MKKTICGTLLLAAIFINAKGSIQASELDVAERYSFLNLEDYIVDELEQDSPFIDVQDLSGLSFTVNTESEEIEGYYVPYEIQEENTPEELENIILENIDKLFGLQSEESEKFQEYFDFDENNLIIGRALPVWAKTFSMGATPYGSSTARDLGVFDKKEDLTWFIHSVSGFGILDIRGANNALLKSVNVGSADVGTYGYYSNTKYQSMTCTLRSNSTFGVSVKASFWQSK